MYRFLHFSFLLQTLIICIILQLLLLLFLRNFGFSECDFSFFFLWKFSIRHRELVGIKEEKKKKWWLPRYSKTHFQFLVSFWIKTPTYKTCFLEDVRQNSPPLWIEPVKIVALPRVVHFHLYSVLHFKYNN